jgi:hypothetical protein
MSFQIPLISEEVITLVILQTILLMMIGNIFYKKEYKPTADMEEKGKGPLFPINI